MGLEFEYIGVSAIVGEEGSCKTTMALSFPKPMFHFELDMDGFARASWRFVKEHPELKVKRCDKDEDLTQIDFSQFDIITKPYPKPLQVNKLKGALTGEAPSARKFQQPKRVEGMKELWQAIVTDFVHAGQQDIASIVFDSATKLWNVAHNARLQELQDIQEYKWKKEHPNTPMPEDEYRERLQPIEYGQPNDRMTTVMDTGKSFRKNLVLTHYPTDEYGMVPDGKGGLVEGKTGKQVIDGFKHTAKECSLIVWTEVKESIGQGGKKTKTPVAKITKCGIEGMGLDAVGKEIMASFDGIISLRNLMRGG